MFLISVLSSVLFHGFLVEPFRVADAEPGHNQTDICSAIAPDGRFAVAWTDETQDLSDVYIRFFDIDGEPVTDPIKMEKYVDGNEAFCPCIGMDSLGNTVLVWVEWESDEVKLQLFDREGNSKGTIQTVIETPLDFNPLALSVNKKGEFVVAWHDRVSDRSHILFRRYSSGATPSSKPFQVHDSSTTMPVLQRPVISLNEVGDVAVAWSSNPILYQVFDSLNQSILPWESAGQILPDNAGISSPRIHWLDNERFILFASTTWNWPFVGTLFVQKDSLKYASFGLIYDKLHSGMDSYSSAVIAERFALNYNRRYVKDDTDPHIYWTHQAAFTGNIINNIPLKDQGPFEYSPPLEGDTSNYLNPLAVYHVTVSANENNLVWGYSRIESDSAVRAYVTVSDWNITGVSERPGSEITAGFEVPQAIGSEVVLRYEDYPQGFRASVFDASGRKVDEISTPNQSGVLFWGPCQNRGVYFIVPQDSKARPTKIVLIR